MFGLAEVFDPRGLPLSLGRSALAAAQLVILAFSPSGVLFAQAPNLSYGRGCDGVRGLSLWCVTGHDASTATIDRLLAICILVVVVSGFRPRWTCVPHWYITFSLAMSLISPDGGERVAQIATMLLIPMLLGDDRVWQWSARNRPLAPSWRGSSYAAHLALRCQISVIYAVAAGSKVAVSAWRHGTALHIIFQDPHFGIAPSLFPAMRTVFDSYAVSAVAGWAAICTEVAIALSVLGSARWQRCGLLLAVALHFSIIVLMGLFSFGLIMIGTVALVIVPPSTTAPSDIRAAPACQREAAGAQVS